MSGQVRYVVEYLTNTTMPLSLIPDKKAFEKAGFVFERSRAEYDVKIPEGWRRESVGPYRVDLYDGDNRLRVRVRKRNAVLLCRYRISQVVDMPGLVTLEIRNGREVLYRGSARSEDIDCQNKQAVRAERWLRAHYRFADNPLAYW